MTDHGFDRFVDRNNPPLVVVTVQVGNELAGCMVGFHAQASIEPELYAVWLSKANRTTRLAVHAEHLAVHYLRAGQIDVAEHWGSLTGDATDKFADVEWEPGPHGLPLLGACPDRLVLERVELVDVARADHVCWLGRVESAHVAADAPGPFRLSDAGGLTPGHPAEDT